MKVKLKGKWFCPSQPLSINNRFMMGRLLQRGVHELPDDMYDILPKSAEVIEAPAFVQKKSNEEVDEEEATLTKKRGPGRPRKDEKQAETMAEMAAVRHEREEADMKKKTA